MSHVRFCHAMKCPDENITSQIWQMRNLLHLTRLYFDVKYLSKIFVDFVEWRNGLNFNFKAK